MIGEGFRAFDSTVRSAHDAGRWEPVGPRRGDGPGLPGLGCPAGL